MRDRRYADEAPVADTPGLTAEERRDERYRRRRAFLNRIGLPDARLTRGRRRRPEARKEADRRYYIRKVAREFGISPGTAEALTPRYPNRGRHTVPARDSSGKFLPSSPTKRPGIAREKESALQ